MNYPLPKSIIKLFTTSFGGYMLVWMAVDEGALDVGLGGNFSTQISETFFNTGWLSDGIPNPLSGWFNAKFCIAVEREGWSRLLFFLAGKSKLFAWLED